MFGKVHNTAIRESFSIKLLFIQIQNFSLDGLAMSAECLKVQLDYYKPDESIIFRILVEILEACQSELQFVMMDRVKCRLDLGPLLFIAEMSAITKPTIKFIEKRPTWCYLNGGLILGCCFLLPKCQQ